VYDSETDLFLQVLLQLNIIDSSPGGMYALQLPIMSLKEFGYDLFDELASHEMETEIATLTDFDIMQTLVSDPENVLSKMCQRSFLFGSRLEQLFHRMTPTVQALYVEFKWKDIIARREAHVCVSNLFCKFCAEAVIVFEAFVSRIAEDIKTNSVSRRILQMMISHEYMATNKESEIFGQRVLHPALWNSFFTACTCNTGVLKDAYGLLMLNPENAADITEFPDVLFEHLVPLMFDEANSSTNVVASIMYRIYSSSDQFGVIFLELLGKLEQYGIECDIKGKALNQTFVVLCRFFETVKKHSKLISIESKDDEVFFENLWVSFRIVRILLKNIGDWGSLNLLLDVAAANSSFDSLLKKMSKRKPVVTDGIPLGRKIESLLTTMKQLAKALGMTSETMMFAGSKKNLATKIESCIQDIADVAKSNVVVLPTPEL